MSFKLRHITELQWQGHSLHVVHSSQAIHCALDDRPVPYRLRSVSQFGPTFLVLQKFHKQIGNVLGNGHVNLLTIRLSKEMSLLVSKGIYLLHFLSSSFMFSL